MTHDDETRHIIEPDGLARRLAMDSRKRLPMERMEARVEYRFGDNGPEARRERKWVAMPGALSRLADPYVLHGGEPDPAPEGDPAEWWQRRTYLDPSAKPQEFDVEEEARKIADLLGVAPDAVKALHAPSGENWASPARAERMLAVKALSDILNTEPRSTMSENTTQADLDPMQSSADEDWILDHGIAIRESGITAGPGTLGTLAQVIEHEGAYWYRWTDDEAREWSRHDNVDDAVAAYEAAVRDTYPLADPDVGYGAWTWTRSDVEGVPTQE